MNRPARTLLLGIALAAALPLAAEESPPPPSAPVATHSVAIFPQERVDIKTWMDANGWESKRNDPRRFEVARACLHMVSEKDSIMIGTERGFPVKISDWPRARVRLRIGKTPAGTNLAKTSGDDAAFRLYVVFDRGGGLFGPPNSLAYTWTENVGAGAVIRSAHFSNVRYLSIGRGVPRAPDTNPGDKPDPGDEPKPEAPDADGWITVERDLTADYRRAFPEDKGDVPDLKAVMLKCDSNDTGTSAEAWVSTIELLAPASEPTR